MNFLSYCLVFFNYSFFADLYRTICMLYSIMALVSSCIFFAFFIDRLPNNSLSED